MSSHTDSKPHENTTRTQGSGERSIDSGRQRDKGSLDNIEHDLQLGKISNQLNYLMNRIVLAIEVTELLLQVVEY